MGTKWAFSYLISVIIWIMGLGAGVRHSWPLQRQASTFFPIRYVRTDTWELLRWGVWDTECLIHFDLELFIWLEVANGQITTLRWYLLFYYVTLRGKKLDIDQNSFAKVVSFSPINLAESTSILSFLSSFIHLFKYVLRHSAGEEQRLLPSRCLLSLTVLVLPSRASTPSFSCWDPAHLAHARLLVMNLTFRC